MRAPCGPTGRSPKSANGQIIGDLTVWVGDAWRQREVADGAKNMQGELGWALNPTMGGQGFATEAVREAVPN
jgi:RimJ/RimL family protein N-acetyltransferase